MSTTPAEITRDWIEAASDRLNPILVKETRQALKSRQFIAAFLLLLVASWAVSVFGMLTAGPGVEFRDVGKEFFFSYYVVLMVAIFIVVPFGAFRSLLSERDQFTYEVLSITTLKPRQVVTGKLLSSLVQLFIYYSAISPFIAFTYLLNGIDIPTIAFALVVSMCAGVMISMCMLTLGTFATQRHWQVLSTLFVLGALVVAFAMSLGLMYEGLHAGFHFDDASFWCATAIFLIYEAAYFMLLLQIAVSQLTFEADNRSTGVRLAASAIFWMSLALSSVVILTPWLGTPPATGDEVNDVLKFVSVATSVQLGVLGLFLVTEPEALSRRVKRSLPHSGLFRRLAFPFLPGGTRGYLFMVMHLGALMLFVLWILVYVGHVRDATLFFVAGISCYIVSYLGIGAALSRWGRALSGEFRSSHARVLTVLFVVFGWIAPHLLHFFDTNRLMHQPLVFDLLFITDPFSTLDKLASRPSSESYWLLYVLGGFALIMLVFNLRALTRAARELVHPDA